MNDDDKLVKARERINMRLQTARMQHKRLPLAHPQRGHYAGLVAGLEEALDLVASTS